MGGHLKIKVAQNGVKHGLILEFLRSDDFFEFLWVSLTSKLTDIHTDTIETR